MGIFKPITISSYLNPHQSFVARYSFREKHTLSLTLGYCFMDFFSYDLNFKEIPSVSLIQKAPPSLSPTSAEPRNIRPGNPVLNLFAKLLVEIGNDETINVDINCNCGENIICSWTQFAGYVDVLDRLHYLDAVIACLFVHVPKYKSL
ncbi:hypothetical protein V8C42DRAFT_333675 [Trichoderma barbatum]